MTKEVSIELEKIPEQMEAIKMQGIKYLNQSSTIQDGAINILYRPWIAQMNWGITLFQGADKNWFSDFFQKTNKVVPDFYMEFLELINGFFIYDMSLYGLTPSIYNSGLLDRENLQCHDLQSANKDWIKEYKVSHELFHFGSRAYSEEENIGYFSDQDNIIKSIRTNGEVLNQWENFSDFLKDEILEAEKIMIKEAPENIK
mgnify:CR=1 FL=1